MCTDCRVHTIKASLEAKFQDTFPQSIPACWGEHAVSYLEENGGSFPRYVRITGELFEKVIEKQLSDERFECLSFPRIIRSIEYFTHIPNDEKPHPIIEIALTVFNLGKLQDEPPSEDQTTLIEKIVELALKQDLYDPDEFVSHTFSHALNVAHYCGLLCKNKAIYRCFESIKNTFGLSDSQIRGTLNLLSFLHDSGYPHLKGRKKANHAVYSADKTDEIRENLLKILGIEGFEEFYHMFREAIFSHNADEYEKDFSHKFTTNSGEFLFSKVDEQDVRNSFAIEETDTRGPRTIQSKKRAHAAFYGRELDLEIPGDKKVGSELNVVDLEVNPYHLIRVADNLDFAFSRFSSLQQKEGFRRIYKLIRLISDKKCTQNEINNYQQELNNLKLLPEFSDLVTKLTPSSMNHFGGCEAIIQITAIKILANTMRVKLKEITTIGKI